MYLCRICTAGRTATDDPADAAQTNHDRTKEFTTSAQVTPDYGPTTVNRILTEVFINSARCNQNSHQAENSKANPLPDGFPPPWDRMVRMVTTLRWRVGVRVEATEQP